mgnify:CR=1 FL=1
MNPAPHPVATRDQWLAQRTTLLAQEKELTRLRDQVARNRRALPWVRVDKNYVFDAPEGRRALAELFEGRRQLLVQHFMLGPGWAQGCPSCSYMADHISGMQAHLNALRPMLLAMMDRLEDACEAGRAGLQRLPTARPFADSVLCTAMAHVLGRLG